MLRYDLREKFQLGRRRRKKKIKAHHQRTSLPYQHIFLPFSSIERPHNEHGKHIGGQGFGCNQEKGI